jgi:primosomal replication protein N
MANRIELCGRLTEAPELRTTPAGTAVLRIAVECGSREGELTMSVVMAGEPARTVAASLALGSEVRVIGSLRAIGGGSRALRTIEIVADEIALVESGRGLSGRHRK